MSDDDVTIVLDDSTDSVQEVFQPVRPGGQKLDETVELESSSDEEEEENYLTTAEPELSAFQTPCAAANPLLARTLDHEESFRNLRPNLNSTPAVVPAAPIVPEDDPFAIRDEFLEDSLAGPPNPAGISFVSGPMVTNITPMPHQPEQTQQNRSEEEVDSAICSQNPSPTNETAVVDLTPALTLEEQLPKTVSILHGSDGGTLYLIGTAHFSEESQKDVAETMRLVRPNTVMLELCKARSAMLHYDEKYLMEQSRNMSFNDMLDSIKQYGTIQGTINFLMTSMAADLTRKLGMAPGGEFRVGFKEAKKLPNCIVDLGDRPIKTTLTRAVNSLSLWQKMTFAYNLMTTNENFTQEDIEKMKEKDMLEQLMEELAGEYPILTEVLVAERDLYLAFSLRACLGDAKIDLADRGITDTEPVVVGIVGMGHVKGITEHWERVAPHDIARISVVPRPSLGERIVRFTFKASFYGVLAYGGYRLLRSPATRLVEKVMTNV